MRKRSADGALFFGAAVIRFGAGEFFGVDNRLVHRRPRRSEIGEFGIDAIALQHIDRRNRFRRALIGKRAFDDRPFDAPRRRLIGRLALIDRLVLISRLALIGFKLLIEVNALIDFLGRNCFDRNILEAAIDHGFKGVEFRLRLLARPIAAFAEGPFSWTAWSAIAVAFVARVAIARTLVAIPLARPAIGTAALRYLSATFARTILARAEIALAIFRASALTTASPAAKTWLTARCGLALRLHRWCGLSSATPCHLAFAGGSGDGSALRAGWARLSAATTATAARLIATWRNARTDAAWCRGVRRTRHGIGRKSGWRRRHGVLRWRRFAFGG